MVHVGAIQPWWTGTVPDNQSTAGAAIWKPGFKPRQLHLILTANHRKLGYFEGNLPLTHCMARSILWLIPWNQIKQCFIVAYLLHLHKPNWSRTFNLLPFPEYIPSFLLHWWQSQGDSLAFSPRREALSKQPNSASKATAAEFWGFFLFQQITSHIWFPQSSPYLPNLSLLMHHWDGLVSLLEHIL